MATIKTMIVDKLRQENRETGDDIVSGTMRQYLDEICRLLPDETPAGQDFVKLVFKIQDEWHKKAISMLIEYAMEERNDLAEYPHIRQKLSDVINNRR